MGWLSKLFNAESDKSKTLMPVAKHGAPVSFGKTPAAAAPPPDNSRAKAANRLKLVLMHDRTQLSPQTMESMRDELVTVISKYVEIDQRALELTLESESNTIALVANIPILRSQAV